MSSNDPKTPSPRSLPKLFLWAQVAAFIGTVVDFSSTYLLADILEWWIVYANSTGAAMGAITNFLMGRYWIFKSTTRKIQVQAFRYIVVSLGSLILNTAGVYLFVDILGYYFFWPKVAVAIFIAFTFNFFMQKNYVYR